MFRKRNITRKGDPLHPDCLETCKNNYSIIILFLNIRETKQNLKFTVGRL